MFGGAEKCVFKSIICKAVVTKRQQCILLADFENVYITLFASLAMSSYSGFLSE